jgi:hypothetical protein
MRCETNKCFCRPSRLGSALEELPGFVLEACQNYDDVAEATSFLLAYCSDRGYTEVETPVPATPTGAWTVTETVAVATVTQTIFVSACTKDKQSPGAIVWPMAMSWVLLASLKTLCAVFRSIALPFSCHFIPPEIC